MKYSYKNSENTKFSLQREDFFFCHECQAFLSHYKNKEDAVERAATPSSPSVYLDPFQTHLSFPFGCFLGEALL